MIYDLPWSKAEKQAARRAFESAFERECRAIRAKVVEMLEAGGDIRHIWAIHDYLSAERRKVDRKYDYRYFVLILVFAKLLREGWVTEADLTGLAEDKLQKIKEVARL